MTALEITNWLEEKIEDYPNKDELTRILKTFKRELIRSASSVKSEENSILKDLEKFKDNIERVKDEMEELDRKMEELNEINEQICKGLDRHTLRTAKAVVRPVISHSLDLLLLHTKKVH